MSLLELQVISPLVVLVSGTLLLMLAVSIRRSHDIGLAITVLTLLAALGANQFVWDALPAGGLTVLNHIHVSAVQLYFNILFVLAAIATALLAQSYLEERVARAEEFYILLLTATTGSIVLASATHFSTFILGLEIVSISLYAMIAYPHGVKRPLEAAAKYLVLSAVASSAILFGMALVYNATGAMSFNELSVDASASQTIYLLGFGLMGVGIAFKLSLVPFHMWTPDVYQGAPAAVTGYVATVSKGAVVAVLLTLVSQSNMLSADGIFYAVGGVAILSMLVGNVLALLQNNIKRLLAYSSIAHLGYLLIAILVMTLARYEFVVQTVLIYVTAYFIITLAAFGVVSISSDSTSEDNEQLDAYTGLFWRQPLLASIMTAVALSLAGIPLTVGFIAKFFVFAVGVEGAIWTLVVVLLIGSAIGIYYYLRIVYTMAKPAPESVPTWPQLATPGLVTVTVLGALILLLGVYPTPMIDAVGIIAAQAGM